MVESWLECQIRPWLERRVRIAIPALRRDWMQLEEPSIHQLLIDAPRSKPCGPSPPASHGSEFGRHHRISQIQMPATQQLPAFSYLPLMLPAVQLVFAMEVLSHVERPSAAP